MLKYTWPLVLVKPLLHLPLNFSYINKIQLLLTWEWSAWFHPQHKYRKNFFFLFSLGLSFYVTPSNVLNLLAVATWQAGKPKVLLNSPFWHHPGPHSSLSRRCHSPAPGGAELTVSLSWDAPKQLHSPLCGHIQANVKQYEDLIIAHENITYIVWKLLLQDMS